MKRFLVKLLGGKEYQMLRISIFSIVLGLLAGAVILLLIGENPLAAYMNLLQGSGLLPKRSYAGKQNMFTDFVQLLDAMTPMVFASLSVAVALKGGLFNIGVSGMMMASGFVASVLVGYSSLAAPIAKPLVLLIGIVTGAFVGSLIGWLKYKFNINEVVSAIMINYILMYVITFFINSYYVDAVSRQSKLIGESARLTLVDVRAMGLKFNIPLAFVLAIIAAFVIRFLMDRTTLGYEIKAVGLSRSAASYAGINIGRNILTTMMLSGALAGLAGVTYFCGYMGTIQPGVIPSMGFNAIAVALLGNSNPVGCIFASFLITIITRGSIYMSSQQGVEIELADVITAIILIFAACSEFFRMYVSRLEQEILANSQSVE
ncbi:MAG: ABC transporter permease [Lachnospiraceae bacterium]|nr:ABC transporter permease [Lachnospiraceae bacterium]